MYTIYSKASSEKHHHKIMRLTSATESAEKLVMAKSWRWRLPLEWDSRGRGGEASTKFADEERGLRQRYFGSEKKSTNYNLPN